MTRRLVSKIPARILPLHTNLTNYENPNRCICLALIAGLPKATKQEKKMTYIFVLLVAIAIGYVLYQHWMGR